jgi:hypothetical protein
MIFWKKDTPLQLLGSCIWNASECMRIPLGRFAPIVFGWMIGSNKKYKSKQQEQ